MNACVTWLVLLDTFDKICQTKSHIKFDYHDIWL